MKKLIIFILIHIFIYSEDGLGDLLETEDYSVDTLLEENMVDRGIDVESIIGEAYLEEGGDNYLQLVQGDNINKGETMITLDNTKVDLAFDKDIEVIIGEKSKVYFENLRGDYRLDEINDSSMELLFGKVYSNIKRKLKKGGKYEIKSGSVVAGVRGTKFTITSYKDGRIEVKVFEGIVTVFNKENEEVEEVRAQELLIIYEDNNYMEKQKHEEKDEKFIQTTYTDVDVLKETIGKFGVYNKVEVLNYDIYEIIKEKAKEVEESGEFVKDIVITVD